MSLILTKAGLDAYAQSEATGTKLQATHMAVGDGGGAPVAHTDTSEALVSETWRGELQKIEVAASGEVEFQGHVPITVGGWYIREIAIYADDTLLALSSHPETWKPAPEAPDKVELVITAPVKFANTDNINLTVDTTKVLASQEHVAAEIEKHNVSEEAHATLLGEYAPKGHEHLTEEVTDLLSDPHTYKAAQRYAQTELEITAGAVVWDCTAAPSAVLLLDQDVTNLTITNYAAGGSYDLAVIQDATGGRTLTMPAGLYAVGGTGYEVSTDANARDLLQLLPVYNPDTDAVEPWYMANNGFAQVS
ncbi:phage tail protein [Pseudodesulfovibrio methanolicus]|uniref:Phage tail protein n=1 Tax=Pseudodesulfovibrio methanolicus TaxID=3126690 RepID=A0ABZ2J3F3_9BACT